MTDLLTTASPEVQVTAVLINMAIAALLAHVLRLVYVRYATSLSNRRTFAANFVRLATTTTLIITVVKSSLALSLGLVGALSIVRFRAAIKEPEELSYLFLAIAIGLGLGADQRLLTVAAFAFIAAVIVVSGFRERAASDQNLHLTVGSASPSAVALEEIVETLRPHCAGLSLRRFHQGEDGLQAAFMVDFADFGQVEASRNALQRLDGSLHVSFVDHRNIL